MTGVVDEPSRRIGSSASAERDRTFFLPLAVSKVISPPRVSSVGEEPLDYADDGELKYPSTPPDGYRIGERLPVARTSTLGEEPDGSSCPHTRAPSSTTAGQSSVSASQSSTPVSVSDDTARAPGSDVVRGEGADDVGRATQERRRFGTQEAPRDASPESSRDIAPGSRASRDASPHVRARSASQVSSFYISRLTDYMSCEICATDIFSDTSALPRGSVCGRADRPECSDVDSDVCGGIDYVGAGSDRFRKGGAEMGPAPRPGPPGRRTSLLSGPPQNQREPARLLSAARNQRDDMGSETAGEEEEEESFEYDLSALGSAERGHNGLTKVDLRIVDPEIVRMRNLARTEREKRVALEQEIAVLRAASAKAAIALAETELQCEAGGISKGQSQHSSSALVEPSGPAVVTSEPVSTSGDSANSSAPVEPAEAGVSPIRDQADRAIAKRSRAKREAQGNRFGREKRACSSQTGSPLGYWVLSFFGALVVGATVLAQKLAGCELFVQKLQLCRSRERLLGGASVAGDNNGNHAANGEAGSETELEAQSESVVETQHGCIPATLIVSTAVVVLCAGCAATGLGHLRAPCSFGEPPRGDGEGTVGSSDSRVEVNLDRGEDFGIGTNGSKGGSSEGARNERAATAAQETRKDDSATGGWRAATRNEHWRRKFGRVRKHWTAHDKRENPTERGARFRKLPVRET